MRADDIHKGQRVRYRNGDGEHVGTVHSVRQDGLVAVQPDPDRMAWVAGRITLIHRAPAYLDPCDV